MQTGFIQGTYAVNNGAVSLSPNQIFKPGELVQVTVTTDTTSVNNENPETSSVWQFRATVSGTGNFGDSGQSLGIVESDKAVLGDLDGDLDIGHCCRK